LEKEHCPKVNIRFNTMFSLEFPRPTYLKTDEKPEETREKTREKTREIILELIAKNPQITTAQLADAIGITPKGVEWQISRLKKDGLLKRIGPAKGGRWDIIKRK
jgi:ATP-dependent DNA helicase RecG